MISFLPLKFMGHGLRVNKHSERGYLIDSLLVFFFRVTRSDPWFGGSKVIALISSHLTALSTKNILVDLQNIHRGSLNASKERIIKFNIYSIKNNVLFFF